jgi:hypothetical protein
MTKPTKLAPQVRPHALADIEAAIAEAEKLSDIRRRALELLDPESACASSGIRRARALLRLAEQRVAELRRSRDVLLAEERSDDDADEAKAP